MQVLFFDGECVMCNSAAYWVARKNGKANIQFASLQSTFAAEKLKDLAPLPDSIVFLDNLSIYTKSQAVLEILKHLQGYRWLRIVRIFPLKFRNSVYDWIARNRIAWFGRQDACVLPSSEYRKRYISD